MFYWFAYYLIKLLSTLFFPFKVIGRENIPAQGSFIFASNHRSNLDPFLIGLSLYRKISYVAKESLFKNKALAFILRKVMAFPIKRDSSDIRSLRESMKRLKAGCPILVFPEGTRKGEAGQKKVHKGIGFLAAKSNVPVIPVYIEGSDRVLPPGARWFRRNPITLTFGVPIQFSAADAYVQISQQIMNQINLLSEK